MGCTQSKIENEEAVARCKERKLHMKAAVAARNAFAAAHSSYAMGLKNTGAALSDYAHGEANLPPNHPSNSSAAAASIIADAPPPPQPPPLVDSFPPPPPPPAPPLQRAATMPEISLPKSDLNSRPKPILEEENADDDEEEDDEEQKEKEKRESLRRRRRGGSRGGGGGSEPPAAAAAGTSAASAAYQPQQDTYDFFFNYDNFPRPTLSEMEEKREEVVVVDEAMKKKISSSSKAAVVDEVVEKVAAPPVVVVVEDEPAPPPPPPPPEEVKSMKKSKTVGGGGGGVVSGQAKRPVNLLKIFVDLDDHFLKASQSAHEVSKMLEATRLHYHSNFADNRGHIDHSARVMRVITWNRSFRGLPNNDDVNNDFDSEEHETHATVLDKLLAWEKKLYDEVKAGEVMKFEYQRKVNSLSKLKKRGGHSDSLEKAKAAVSLLHTRYIVDMQAMDSTVSEINRLRDQQLYPKLVQLVDGMATMWETMRQEHEAQSRIVQTLKYIDISQTLKETSEHHHNITVQLCGVVHEWCSQFEKLMQKQREYIKSLNAWLRLNLIPTETSLKEKVSSPPRPQTPPIQKLLIAWHDHLDKLPDEVARSAISNFAAVIDTIVIQQDEEMRLREKCEETRKELSRKTRAFEDWYRKYMQRMIPDEADPDRVEGNNSNEAVVERQVAVDLVKKRLEEEQEAYQRHCLQVREKSLVSLRTRLPELFRALSEISVSFSAMYSELRARSQPRNRNESSA